MVNSREANDLICILQVTNNLWGFYEYGVSMKCYVCCKIISLFLICESLDLLFFLSSLLKCDQIDGHIA